MFISGPVWKIQMSVDPEMFQVKDGQKETETRGFCKDRGKTIEKWQLESRKICHFYEV